MSAYDFTYLSFGAGVQSTAVLLMATERLHGCPAVDVAIFADTGDEPTYVYEHVDRVRALTDIPIETVGRDRSLSASAVSGERFAAIPLFTRNADKSVGMLRRQCTREYKIEPIEKRVRERLGYKPRQRVKHTVRCLLGISVDEVQRMKPSRTRWVTNAYPLIEGPRPLSRLDCQRMVADAGWPAPHKSSCVFCPFHSDAFWRTIKQTQPDEWARACAFDDAIRHKTMRGVERPAYVHRSCVPLRDADLSEDQGDMFGNECDGYCGV